MNSVSTSQDERTEVMAIQARLLGAVLALAGIGLVMVYSASAIRSGRGGWDMAYAYRQTLRLIMGLVAMAVISHIPYTWYRKLWAPIGLGILLLLAAVRVPGIGREVNGAYRWFRFGGLNLQPSELAKVGMVIVVAALIARCRTRQLPFWRGFLPAAGVIGLTSGLIAIEPDFGTAALVGAVLFCLLYVGGARLCHIALMGLVMVPPVAIYGVTRFNHILDRVQAWRSGATDGSGYQTYMSKIALGSGGSWGMGLGEGTAKLYFLPEAHTDFIFAIAGQELGLVGTLLIVLLFGILVWEGLRLARTVADPFAGLVVLGIILFLGTQAIFNMAVVTNLVPPKGISLPFVSYGGSGLVISLGAMGIVSSIARNAPLRERTLGAPSSDESPPEEIEALESYEAAEAA